MIEEEEIKSTIALGLVNGIGPVVEKELISKIGSASEVFSLSDRELMSFKKIGEAIVSARSLGQIFSKADQELNFINQNQISILDYRANDYPKNLKQCGDAPLLLFKKGNGLLNESRSVSIVGTRKATNYGKDFCKKLIHDLSDLDIAIHSGLAYGIDIASHRAAIDSNVATYCTLAHGLDRVYPSAHKSTANSMLDKGGWISEFLSETRPDRENFPKRNRIVAGISDVTIVVESAKKGGSIITANLANSYSRDVFALPGRHSDERSEGCNFLIKTNRAHLIESVDDLLYVMNWNATAQKKKVKQASLFPNLSKEDEKLVAHLKSGPTSIDELCRTTQVAMADLSTQLLMLEFDGVVRPLPGKIYELIT